jgi:hypothetical protein
MTAGEIPKDKPRSSLLPDGMTSVAGPSKSPKDGWDKPVQLAFLGAPGNLAPVTMKPLPPAVPGLLPELLPWAVVAGAVTLGLFAIGQERQEYEARVQAAMAALGLAETRDNRRVAQAYVYAINIFSLQQTQPDAATQDRVARDVAGYVAAKPYLFGLMGKGNQVAAGKLLDKFYQAWADADPKRWPEIPLPSRSPAREQGVKPLAFPRVPPPHDARDGDLAGAMLNQGASDQDIRIALENRRLEREVAAGVRNGNGIPPSRDGGPPAPPPGGGGKRKPSEWQKPTLLELSLGAITLGGETQDEHELYLRQNPDIDRHSMGLLSHIPSMAYLLEVDQQPGSFGVIVDGGFRVDPNGKVIVDEQFRKDLWALSRAREGIEFGVRTRAGSKTEVMLQSGSERSVQVFEGWQPLAHTHPGGNPWPSPSDLDAANMKYRETLERNPDAEPQPLYIVWGPENYTQYYPRLVYTSIADLEAAGIPPQARRDVFSGEVDYSALYKLSGIFKRRLAAGEKQDGSRAVGMIYRGEGEDDPIVPDNIHLAARIHPYRKLSDIFPSAAETAFLDTQYRRQLESNPNAPRLSGLVIWGTGAGEYTIHFAAESFVTYGQPADQPPPPIQRPSGKGVLLVDTDVGKADFTEYRQIALNNIGTDVAVISADGVVAQFEPYDDDMDKGLSWLIHNAKDKRVALAGGADHGYRDSHRIVAARVTGLEARLRSAGFEVVFRNLYGEHSRTLILDQSGEFTVSDSHSSADLAKFQFERQSRP